MKILVIGNGFIGSAIIRRLELEGHELLIFSRSKKVGIKSPQVSGDIFNFNELITALSWNPQVIIHTAWITSHRDYPEHSSNYDYAKFTAKLASFTSRTNLEHLIILGSCAEYGHPNRVSVAGVTDLSPNNLYARQKIEAMNSAKTSLLGTEVRLTWARIFQPYGPNQDYKRLIPSLIKSLKSNLQVTLNDTTSVLDWITTRDIASAISWLIIHNTPIEVDIGTGIGYTSIEILEQLEGLLGRSDQSTRIDAQSPFEKRVMVVGKDSPIFESGWRPSDTLKSGLEWVLQS